MPARGRPALTEEVVEQRLLDYCARYGVTERNAEGFPVYPTGERETPQHREWILLYKAWSRVRRRAGLASGSERAEALRAQRGRCAVCLETVDTGAELVRLARPCLLHPACAGLVRRLERLGRPALDRIRELLTTS